MCTLERDWLRRNSAGGDDVPGEMGRVVGLREGVDTQFCLEVDTGDTLTCTLPQLFTQFSGIIRYMCQEAWGLRNNSVLCMQEVYTLPRGDSLGIPTRDYCYVHIACLPR